MSSITHASSIADLPAPVAVCCHDAGASNLIAAWVAEATAVEVLVCADGPAQKVFADVVPHRPAASVAEIIRKAGCLLSGSGWASTLEYDARISARQRGLPVLAVLDHWVNYRMRFSRNGLEALPDVFVVTDPQAAALAAATFGTDRPILMWENRYLLREVEKIKEYSRCAVKSSRMHLLVLLEPIRRDWDPVSPDLPELRALDYLMENLDAISPTPAEMVIRLRLHPSESPSKYLPWMSQRRDDRIGLSAGESLAEDLAWADVTTGLQSYALVVACESGRRAICYLPPGAPACSLRISGLEHLNQMIERRQ